MQQEIKMDGEHILEDSGESDTEQHVCYLVTQDGEVCGKKSGAKRALKLHQRTSANHKGIWKPQNAHRAAAHAAGLER